jgi:Tfp pilus assembly protein PilF
MKAVTKTKAFFVLGCLAILAICGCSSAKPARLNAAKSLTACGPSAAELGEKMAREGKRQYEEGLLKSAERVLEKAVQIDPTNQKAWYYLHCVKESLYGAEKEQQYWHDRTKR